MNSGRSIASAIKYDFASYQAKYPTGLSVWTDFSSISGAPDYEVINENTQVNVDQIVAIKAGGMTISGNTLQAVGTFTTTVFNDEIVYSDYVLFNNFTHFQIPSKNISHILM